MFLQFSNQEFILDLSRTFNLCGVLKYNMPLNLISRGNIYEMSVKLNYFLLKLPGGQILPFYRMLLDYGKYT